MMTLLLLVNVIKDRNCVVRSCISSVTGVRRILDVL